MAGADDDSFSSDSDDEFLTLGKTDADGSGGADREAMIRKKLMESFYGKSADLELPKSKSHSSAASSVDSLDDDDDEDEDATDPLRAEDLDAPQFNAAAHTQKHVFSSGVHPLLETEEALACQVRTLDSSLQTMVYENYSRFIEATDAIRSIGVNVEANNSNLSQLESNLNVIAEQSRSLEETVGPLRDQVVEKLRVKRLLQRLDTLLKLPSTLRQQIQKGKYRWATQSYLSAYSILSKHSAGFESLQRIETECQTIMSQLLVDVRRKLVHWSGELLMDEDEGETKEEETLPDPPKSIVEILECAGTPPLILQNTNQEAAKLFDPKLTVEQCQDMALGAGLRYLERILDTHHIELQEQQLLSASAGPASTKDGDAAGATNSTLVPTAVLDNILEASTLYSMSFLAEPTSTDNELASPARASAVDDGSPTQQTRHDERLSNFVSAAFQSFLQHVRGELLELTMIQQQQLVASQEAALANVPTASGQERASSGTSTETAEAAADDEDPTSEQIAAALSTLVVSVRELAAGLALPEVALSTEMTSTLVDQTVGLTEAMVRRRVDQKFYSLRLRVIQDCLVPFCQAFHSQSDKSKEEDADASEGTSLLEAIQLASVALSDSLQLVDDTIRSVLANTEDDDSGPMSGGSSSGSSDENSMLKEAVEQSAQRFTKWMASALEILAGFESTDPKVSLQVKATLPEDEAGGDDPASSSLHPSTPSSGYLDVLSTSHIGEDEASMGESGDSLVERAMLELVSSVDQPSGKMILAIAELCRVAERSVVENIHQSIASHTHSSGGKPRKAGAGLFSENEDALKNANPTSDRFRLAASRILNLHAMNRGHAAAQILCHDLPSLAGLAEDEVKGPRPAISEVLNLAKSTSEECADLFGCSRRAGPPPENLEDEYASLTALSRKSMNRTALAFDVERMFAEKVIVYPHPNEVMEFQRNPFVVLVLKVALKEWAESARLVTCSLGGYRQWVVDTEFLKWYIPHFIKDEALSDGSNARGVLESLLTDGRLTAKARCSAMDRVGEDVEETNLARGTIRDYVEANTSTPSFVITEE